MAQHQRSIEIKVGIFVLVCVLVGAFMIIRFGKYTRLAERTYEIGVVFPNVGGIVKDANVMLAGIPVGKVRAIGLKEDGALRVKLTLAIYEGVTIRKDAKFVINQAGLLGDRYVDVIAGTVTADPISPGEELEGSPSVDLSEAIRSVVDVLRQAASTIERVDKAIQRVDEIVLDKESLSHVSSALANVDTTTSNAMQFAAGLRDLVQDNRGQIDAALTGFSEASANFNSASKRVDEASLRVNDLIESNRSDLRAVVQNLADGTQRLNTLLAKLEKGEGTLGKLLVDPALHDEVLELVQNWRRHGILYKDRASDRKKAGIFGRSTEPGTDQLIFGTDMTKSSP